MGNKNGCSELLIVGFLHKVQARLWKLVKGPEPCALMAQQGLLPVHSSQGSAPPELPAPASWPISAPHSPLSHDELTLLPPQDLE